MAALVQGVQYGLSSQGNFQEDKSLIFVKLTDSAYRAIEGYLRNRSKSNQQPTIQFQGKEGHLSFPAPDSSHGQARFKFSLSSFEGPQGSFECISQKGSRSLETVGAMQCNMRIQAKDDVYEATKHRMAVVEENQKNKCTREIKPGLPGIGRKVKVKNPILPPRRDREYLGPSAPALKNSSSIKASSNGFPPFSHNNLNGNFVPSSQHTKPQGNNHAQKPGNPDIMRRPIKERLIQLLAVRPYKKPELYDRLIKDGLRDREKHCLSVMLKQVAQMKDNTYHLIRHVWNDVQEDWPFYTEQERQSLKRRKPQNLTPPGSSDGGSSGSGQSPTSTHPGSPPSTISSSYTAKRPGYMEGADGLPTKRQRISHYRKPAELASVTSYRLPDSSQQHQRSAAADSSSRANDMLSYRRQERQDSSHHNGGRELAGGGRNNNSNNNNNNSGGEMAVRNNGYNIQSNGDSGKCTGTQENEENVGGSAQGSYESVVSSGKYRLAHSETLSSRNGGDNSVSVSNNVPSEGPALGWNNRADSGGGVLSTSTSSRGHGGHHDNRNSRWNTNNGGAVSSTQSITSHHSSPDSQLENVDSSSGGSKDNSKSSAGETNSEFPDYFMCYSSIRNSEQRNRYKADFNADYSEYRDLHAVVEKVSRRFAQLEERLRQHEKNSPAYKSVKHQIVQEYQENKRDLKYQEAKKRFQYLHEKLSHIKRLVLEYDSQAVPGGDRY